MSPTPEAPLDHAALIGERRRRQEAEQRIAALEAHYAQMAQQAKPPEEEADFWVDPNAHLQQRFDRFAQDFMTQFEQRQTAQKIDASEAAAKAKYADYDEKFAAFQAAVQLNPKLSFELVNAPDPGEFAYSRGKTALEIERHGSIDALLVSERAKWEAEVRAQAPARPSLPSTTAADGSVGSRSGPEWSGPRSFDELFR